MGHVFSVELPFDFDASTFDVLELEPDIEGTDWVEEDPQLPDGTASLYVYGRSTVPVELHLDEELEVWVPSFSSTTNWEIAFDVLARATEMFDTAFVTWNDGDLWELPELAAACGEAWQIAQFEADLRELETRVAGEGTATVRGPLRGARIGPRVLGSMAAGECTLEEVLLRTNFVTGPHLVAEAVVDSVNGKPRALTVLGPGLRTLLPPVDAVLLDTIDAGQPPVLVAAGDLDGIEGLDVVRLDESHRLVRAVPESAWPTVLKSALSHAIT
jgi:hypothetical protein